MPTDHYGAWKRELAGDARGLQQGAVGSGFWRLKAPNGFTPIATWWAGDDEGYYLAQVADDEEQMADETFAHRFFARCRAVYEADYRFFEKNKRWPEDVSQERSAIATSVTTLPAGPAPNATDQEATRAAIKEQKDAADAYLKEIGGKVLSKEQADKLANIKTRIAELHGEAEKKRVAQVAPHLKAQRDTNAAWNPVIDFGKKVAGEIDTVVFAWQQAEKKRIAEEALKAAAQGAPVDLKAAAASMKAGTRGRGVTPIQTRELMLDDVDAMLAYYYDAKDPRFMFEAKVIAARLAKTDSSGKEPKQIPGTRWQEGEKPR